jgi:hypothetical protein
MSKQLDPANSVFSGLNPEHWMNLETVARIEVTSEDRSHPVEDALSPSNGTGWRAAEPGRQILRVLFDEPQALHHIHLVFAENQTPRTQEVLLRWSRGSHQPFEQIVRQQYNFAPPSREIEDYAVELNGVKRLEMEINPSIGGGDYYASLAELRLR